MLHVRTPRTTQPLHPYAIVTMIHHATTTATSKIHCLAQTQSDTISLSTSIISCITITLPARTTAPNSEHQDPWHSTTLHHYHHVTSYHTTIASSHSTPPSQHRTTPAPLGFISAGGPPLMVAKMCWGLGGRAKNGSTPHPRGLSVREGREREVNG